MKKKLLIFSLLLTSLLALTAVGLTVEEYFELASANYLEGDYQAALKDINKILKIEPTHAGALQLKAVIEEETGAPSSPIKKVISSPDAAKSVSKKKSQAKPQTIIRPKPLVIYKEVPKLVTAPVIAIQKPPAGTAAAAELKQIRSQLRLIALLFSLVFLVPLSLLIHSFLDKWRHLHDVFCSECKTRNKKEAEFCRKCDMRLRAPEFHQEQKLWLEKFGWRKNPFTLSVMPETFAGHQKEISQIMEKLNTLSGHVLVIGGLGTGKTTLLQWLERNLKYKFETIYLLRPPNRPEELVDFISATISKNERHTHKYSIYQFRKLCATYKRNILLLIDEAHEISEGVEQFIRTLGDCHNVFLVVAGLPQTREMIKRDLPALFDRLVETVLLAALTREETEELIRKRIAKAGGKGLGPFTVAALNLIYKESLGIPRAILKICDWLVAHGVRKNKVSLDEADVKTYIDEMKHHHSRDLAQKDEKEKQAPQEESQPTKTSD